MATEIKDVAATDGQYRQLFHELPVGMFVFTGGDHKLELNSALARIFGYASAAMVMALPASDQFLHPAERERLLSLLLQRGSVTDFIASTERRDGAQIWISIDARAVIVKEKVVRLEGVVRDVTDQVTAATEQSETQERAEAVAEVSRHQLEHAQLQVWRRALYQETVIKIGARALVGSDHLELMQDALAAIATVLEVPLGAVFEVEHENNVAIVSAAIADAGAAPPIGSRFPLSLLSNYTAMQLSGKAVAVEDYDKQPEFTRNEMMCALGVRSSLTALIPAALAPVGTIALFSRSPRAWTSDEVDFVQLIGNMLSTALQRTRAEDQRRLLLARLVTAQEEERRSIANEIHDDAVQVMTAASLRLEIVRRQLGDAAGGETAERLQETISLSIRRLRHLLFELSPPALERSGLLAAVQMSLDQLHADTGVDVELSGALGREPDMARRTMVYRVVQEAVSNIRKHASATRVHVAVEADDAGTTLVITDDGDGFVVADVENPRPGHLGITAMHERMELAGGWVRITSEAGQGTMVRLWMPA